MPPGVEEEILEMSKILDKNPDLIEKEVQFLIDEYQALYWIIARIRKMISDLDPRVFSYPHEREAWVSHISREIDFAVSICLRERKLGEKSTFKRFARIIDREVLADLTIFRTHLARVANSKEEVAKDYEKLVVNPLLKAINELKRDIQNEEIRAQIARKALS